MSGWCKKVRVVQCRDSQKLQWLTVGVGVCLGEFMAGWWYCVTKKCQVIAFFVRNYMPCVI